MASKISWYGGHMAKTVRELKERLRLVDMVLEVRDARIPFSSANPELEKLIRHKRRLLVLNKADLAAPDKQQAVLHKLEEQKLKALFTSGQKHNSVQKLLQAVMSTLQREKPKADMLMIMTVGIPNSGKSTLINAMRHGARFGKHNSTGGKAAVGATPGLTRNIAGFQVGERPTAFLMDTPGVMLPNVPDEQTGMRLALTGAVKDSIVSEDRLVRYLLQELARQPQFAGTKSQVIRSSVSDQSQKIPLVQQAVFSAVTAMRQAATLINEPINKSANHPNMLSSAQLPDHDAHVDAGIATLHHVLKQDELDIDRLNAAYKKVLHAYRIGDFGRYTLDQL